METNSMINEVTKLAIKASKGHTLGEESYINYIGRIVSILKSINSSDELIAAAWLYGSDISEDFIFGVTGTPTVSTYIKLATEDVRYNNLFPRELCLARYREQLKQAPAEVQDLKLAIILANLKYSKASDYLLLDLTKGSPDLHRRIQDKLKQ